MLVGAQPQTTCIRTSLLCRTGQLVKVKLSRPASGRCALLKRRTLDNHVCYLLEEEGMVFAGDHIMNGSTVVIIPSAGDMKDYIASLQKLLDYNIKCIAPGHGGVIPDCHSEVTRLVEHRLMRESKVSAG